MTISRDDIDMLSQACREFLDAVAKHDYSLLNRPKLHLLLHLPKCVEDFGATCSFNSER